MNNLPKEYIEVLDKGYVGLVDSMGTDLTPVAAARVSYNKTTKLEEDGTLNSKDERLLDFLVREQHTSPMRHAALSFEVNAPLIVARQWWKYAVASTHVDNNLAWNESSRRYITEQPEFYVPRSDQWRTKPANSKQGSGPAMRSIPDSAWQSVKLADDYGNVWTMRLLEHIKNSEELYEYAMQNGMAPEQARLFLPAYAMYVKWRWTASLAAVLHFIEQRTAGDAQYEIQQYAKAVKELTTHRFPKTVEFMLRKSG